MSVPSIPEDELEQQIVKCFGDAQQYDGGWFAQYDGKWIDITNDVTNLVAVLHQYAAKARIDEAEEALDRFCELDCFDVKTATPEARKIWNHVIQRHNERIKQLRERE